MGTRGDPLFDLATLLSYWAEPGDPQCMHDMKQLPTAAPGFQTRAKVAAYARLTGTDVSDFPAFRVLAMYKLAVVLLQLHALWRRGAAEGPRYAGLAKVADELLEMTHDVAQGPDRSVAVSARAERSQDQTGDESHGFHHRQAARGVARRSGRLCGAT